MRNPFRYFKTSPEVIRLAVMMYIRFPLSLRQVEDLLHERGIDICHETVRFWWNRFGPMLAAEIRKKRSAALRTLPQWRWHERLSRALPFQPAHYAHGDYALSFACAHDYRELTRALSPHSPSERSI